MQEEIEQPSFNLIISTTKLAARTVLRAVKAAEDFVKLNDAFIACKAVKKVQFGQAECLLCDAKKVFEIGRASCRERV